MEKLKDKIEKYINKTGVIRTPAYFIKDLFNDVVELFNTISNKIQNNSIKIQDINNNLLLDYYLANEDIGLYATYNITNIDSPTIIFTKKFADIIIYNDKIINVENGEYTFDSIGQHVVRYITTNVPPGAFTNIDSLIELHIKDGVKKMGENSITNCQNLITLEIGKDVTGRYVFSETNNINTLILQQFINGDFFKISYDTPNENLINNIKNLILDDNLNDVWEYWQINYICPQLETLYIGKNIQHFIYINSEQYKIPTTVKTIYFNNNKLDIYKLVDHYLENLYIKEGSCLYANYFSYINNVYIEGDFTYKETFKDPIYCNNLYIRKNTHFNLFSAYLNNIKLYDYDTKERINKLVDVDLEKVTLNYYDIDTVTVKNNCTIIKGNTYVIGDGFIKNIVFPYWVKEIQYYPGIYLSQSKPFEYLVIPSNYEKISTIKAKCIYFQGTIEQWLNKVTVNGVMFDDYESKLYCYNELIKDVHVDNSEQLKALQVIKLNSITTNIQEITDDIFANYGFSGDGDNLIAEKIILNNIKSIGWQSFYRNINMKEIVIDKTIEYLDSSIFAYCTNLHTIIIKALNAPTHDTSALNAAIGNSSTGENTAAQGINKLIVPTGATGYDSSYWTTHLLNPDECNFTIEYSDELAAELNGEATT